MQSNKDLMVLPAHTSQPWKTTAFLPVIKRLTPFLREKKTVIQMIYNSETQLLSKRLHYKGLKHTNRTSSSVGFCIQTTRPSLNVCLPACCHVNGALHSTVTDLARFLGQSTCGHREKVNYSNKRAYCQINMTQTINFNV